MHAVIVSSHCLSHLPPALPRGWVLLSLFGFLILVCFFLRTYAFPLGPLFLCVEDLAFLFPVFLRASVTPCLRGGCWV